MAGILLSSSAVRVHDSQAYRKMDMTRERISCILELTEILMSFKTGFTLVNVAVVCAILEILNRWTEYCAELCNCKASGDLSVLDCPQTDRG